MATRRIVGLTLTPALVLAVAHARSGLASEMYRATAFDPSVVLTGLNNAGQVSGYGPTANHRGTYAFRYNSYGPDAGKIENVGGTYSFGLAINDRGVVKGGYGVVNTYNEPGHLWSSSPASTGSPSPGDFDSTPLGPLSDAPSPNFVYLGMSDHGQVLGYSSNPSTWDYVPILWNGTTPQDLRALVHKDNIGPLAINHPGAIFGVETRGETAHPFLYQDGRVVDLPGLPERSPGIFRGAYLNDKGDALLGWGTSLLLFHQGVMEDITDRLPLGLKPLISDVIAFNDRGQILVKASTAQSHGFLHDILLTLENQAAPADPIYPEVVPEPATILLWSAPLLAALVLRRAGRRPALP